MNNERVHREGLLRVGLLVAAGLWLLLSPPGCAERTASPPGQTTAGAQNAATPSRPGNAPPQEAPLADRESWYVYYIEGARVGYGRTTIRTDSQQDRKVVRIEGLSHLELKRFGQQVVQEVRFTSVESPSGGLIAFDTEIRQAQTSAIRTRGKVVGDRLEVETTTAGKTASSSIPWSEEYGGMYAVERSLLRRPMRPGERRTIRALVPGFGQVATVELSALEYEQVRLLGGTFELLRINTVMRFPGDIALQGATWIDRTGEVLKNWTAAMQVEEIRATKALALQRIEPSQFDLGWDTTVKVERPLPGAHDTRRVRYHVRLEDGDPAGVFFSGPTQQVTRTGPHTAEITVFALRPGQSAGNLEVAEEPPSAADLQPNSMIQSDDPKIVAMARNVAGEETDAWRIVGKLEQYVHELIAEKDFSQAFATAAEVAENPVGDCSEHAVLLAALARALEIPARTAVGLVYMEGTQSFGYHMWTEVHVKGRWIPVDATLAKGGIGAAHLKLSHANLAGSSVYSSFLPVLQVAGRLQIRIEEVE